MPHTLNSIYFTKDGILPRKVVGTLVVQSKNTVGTGFQVIFWTDVSRLNREDLYRLRKSNVIVKDYRAAPEPYLGFIEKFLKLGHEGDVCSYAIASDILRVALIDITPINDIYVYADCNDVLFDNLQTSLSNLALNFHQNPWGLAFPINILKRDANDKIIAAELRNDCMIVRKSNNALFFEHFLSLYLNVLKEKAPAYVVTSDNTLKKKQADEISSFTSSIPFRITIHGRVYMHEISPRFSPATITQIQFSEYIQHFRDSLSGSSWRDVDLEEERKLLEEVNGFPDSLSNDDLINFDSELPEEEKVFSVEWSDNLSEICKILATRALASTRSTPFNKYNLYQVYEEDGVFIVKNSPNNLFKVYNWGAHNVRYESVFYNYNTREITTDPIIYADENVIKKIEQFIAGKSVQRQVVGAGNILSYSSMFKSGIKINRELKAQITECLDLIYPSNSSSSFKPGM